jgi:hypothetical protein
MFVLPYLPSSGPAGLGNHTIGPRRRSVGHSPLPVRAVGCVCDHTLLTGRVPAITEWDRFDGSNHFTAAGASHCELLGRGPVSPLTRWQTYRPICGRPSGEYPGEQPGGASTHRSRARQAGRINSRRPL